MYDETFAGEASVSGRYDISRRCGRSAWTITALCWWGHLMARST
jgi:hypothetical protein